MGIHSGWRCVILLVLLTACNREKATPPVSESSHGSASSVPPTPVSPGQVALPRERKDSIRIEGDWQPMTLRLVQPASTMPFLTYVPADMIVESRPSGASEEHYFIANFGGKRNDDAYLVMHVFPPGMSMDSATVAAKAFRDGEKRKLFVVTMDLRKHGDRFYYIGEHYPAEYGDGFSPRSAIIQQQWQWLDATSVSRSE